MESEEWKKLGRGSDPDARDDFRSSLQVITPPEQPEWIYVRFTDAEPKAAQIAVFQLIAAYEEIHEKPNSSQLRRSSRTSKIGSK
jgi:hypothetical protein